MPSLIDIRRRIRAVKSTQQITKALKMVAAANLRRSQERALSSRPYSKMTERIIRSLATRVDSTAHPLLARPEDQNGPALVIVVTGDKGMSGSFNATIIRATANFVLEHGGRPVTLGLVGRKGRDFFRRRSYPTRFEMVNFLNKVQFSHAQEIAQEAMNAFTKGEVEQVFLAYNEFKSVLQQRVVINQLLPIPHETVAPDQTAALVDYLYEPNAQALFDALLPRYVETEVWHALLESIAAQNAAQMVAMDNATKNSAEVIDSLTITMNKVRQAAITREIIEVVSGAQAL